MKSNNIKYIFYLFIIIIFLLIFNSQLQFINYKYSLNNNSNEYNIKYLFTTIIDATFVISNSFLQLFDTEEELKSSVSEVRLRISKGSLEKMVSNLPYSAKKYYKAELLYPDNSWKTIKYRLRGRNIWHWDKNKPSLRLKLPKDRLYDNQRNINLINPEDRSMVVNLLGEKIASSMGVLTHITSYKKLFIDDKYFGIYHQTTNDDEEMLRLNHRIPGPIYVGDNLKIIWDIKDFKVKGDLDVLSFIHPMEDLLKIINNKDDIKQFNKAWDIISINKYAKYIAALSIAGGIHSDYTHNQLFYFDPKLGKIEPIISDINGHGLLTDYKGSEAYRIFDIPKHRIPINERINPLFAFALKDPRFVHLRNKFLYQGLNKQGSVNSQRNYLRTYKNLIENDVLSDKRKASLYSSTVGWYRLPYSNWQYKIDNDEIISWIIKRNDYLYKELLKANVEVEYQIKIDYALVNIAVSGNSSVIFKPNDVNNIHPIINNNIKSFSNNNEIILHPGLKINNKLYDNLRELNDRRHPKYRVKSSKQYYLFKIYNITETNLKKYLNNAFYHSLNNELVLPTLKKENTFSSNHKNYSHHIWDLVIPYNESNNVSLGPGQFILVEDLIIPSDKVLTVHPGTILRLNKGVSIASKGKVLMNGKKNKPIKIIRNIKDQAWGAIIIQGERTSNSIFNYVIIDGGSTDKYFNIDYSGMINVYGSDNFTLNNSNIKNNLFSDDLLNIVYGNANIDNTFFQNCFADCIDFDYTNSNLNNINIITAGNDGIDFMSSKSLLLNIHIAKTSDKSISVGENSNIHLKDSSIAKSLIGIAVKDDSFLNINNTIISSCSKGIFSYKKNWRFNNAGSIVSNNINFKNNDLDVQINETGKFYYNSDNSHNISIFGDGEFLKN